MSGTTADTLRLTPSNVRSVVLFIAMLVWFGIGVSRYLAVGGLLWIALSLVGFAGALVYALMLLPGSSYLEATPISLTICTAFRKRNYSWHEIDSFKVDAFLHKKVVKYELRVVDDAEADGAVGDRDGTQYREETLPDTYGLSPEKLADRLNVFRRRYG